MNWLTLREGFHIFRNAHRKPKTYTGDAKKICEQIVAKCWNGTYYQTSLHNYTGFYCRDFGMCVDSLLALGKKKEVRQTLTYALSRFQDHGKVTQQLNDQGKAFMYPNCEQPDALAFLLHAIDALGDEELIMRHHSFLEKEVVRLIVDIIDPATMLVKRGVHVAGMRDHAIRDSSCYDNVMVLAIQKYAHRLGLKMPLHVPKKQLEQFWNGRYFKDDLSGKNSTTGDANVVPFWFGVAEKELLGIVLEEISKNGLDKPYALRYESHYNHEREMMLVSSLTDGWEHDTVWLHLGNMFLQVMAKHDKKAAKKHLQQHRELIERNKHYPEVLTKEGKLQQSFFFRADDSMLWAANFLALSKALDKQ